MSVNADSLSGRVVLLAGVTGELGSHVARLLRARGARLGLLVRKPRQVAEITQAFAGEGVLVGSVGPQDSEGAAGFAKGVADSLGPIDALIATNGAFAASTVGKEPSGELAELLEANLLTVATLARAVVGPMRRRRTGRIVAVGAAAVEQASPGLANYLAAKAALHRWIVALDRDLEGSGVRALAVLPTTIDTASNRQTMPAADRRGWQSLDAVSEALVACAFGVPPAGPLYRVPA
ncbi:MAG: SDR family NAD(P)-dependent oxidoreductase [Planctomycetes bacterium]|nr:SDR family NAD(P)-dependent oxidoreductase [Planctomycetota bacterium]